MTLTPGAWKLYCSLFAGTPDSHEDQGMAAVIRAKRAAGPARRAQPDSHPSAVTDLAT